MGIDSMARHCCCFSFAFGFVRSFTGWRCTSFAMVILLTKNRENEKIPKPKSNFPFLFSAPWFYSAFVAYWLSPAPGSCLACIYRVPLLWVISAWIQLIIWSHKHPTICQRTYCSTIRNARAFDRIHSHNDYASPKTPSIMHVQPWTLFKGTMRNARKAEKPLFNFH